MHAALETMYVDLGSAPQNLGASIDHLHSHPHVCASAERLPDLMAKSDDTAIPPMTS
jgi:hypothetical protein